VATEIYSRVWAHTVLPIFLSPTSPVLSLDVVVLAWLELQVRDRGADFGDDVSDVWSTESEIECLDPLAPLNFAEVTEDRMAGRCPPSWY
jgi:hypothetical protein